jgi:hypothetical protein
VTSSNAEHGIGRSSNLASYRDKVVASAENLMRECDSAKKDLTIGCCRTIAIARGRRQTDSDLHFTPA